MECELHGVRDQLQLLEAQSTQSIMNVSVALAQQRALEAKLNEVGEHKKVRPEKRDRPFIPCQCDCLYISVRFYYQTMCQNGPAVMDCTTVSYTGGMMLSIRAAYPPRCVSMCGSCW